MLKFGVEANRIARQAKIRKFGMFGLSKSDFMNMGDEIQDLRQLNFPTHFGSTY